MNSKVGEGDFCRFVTKKKGLFFGRVITDLPSDGVGIKSTRKTWESYLVATYPQQSNKIFLSQGHSSGTALQHYLTIPFSDDDKKEMMYFVEGW